MQPSGIYICIAFLWQNHSKNETCLAIVHSLVQSQAIKKHRHGGIIHKSSQETVAHFALLDRKSLMVCFVGSALSSDGQDTGVHSSQEFLYCVVIRLRSVPSGEGHLQGSKQGLVEYGMFFFPSFIICPCFSTFQDVGVLSIRE